MVNWPLWISTFSLIFLAELPDKTAFATLIMATRGKPGAIFTGVAVAFFIQCAIAVTFGSVIGLLPAKWIHLGAGILFLAFAAHTWLQEEENEAEEAEIAEQGPSMGARFWRQAWKAFLMIFIAEWGDLTQLATASLAAHYRHDLITIFSASFVALLATTAIAIFVGSRARNMLHAKWLKAIGTLTFAAVGIYFLLTV